MRFGSVEENDRGGGEKEGKRTDSISGSICGTPTPDHPALSDGLASPSLSEKLGLSMFAINHVASSFVKLGQPNGFRRFPQTSLCDDQTCASATVSKTLERRGEGGRDVPVSDSPSSRTARRPPLLSSRQSSSSPSPCRRPSTSARIRRSCRARPSCRSGEEKRERGEGGGGSLMG